MQAINTCFTFLARTAGYLRRSRLPHASIPDLQKSWSLETLERFKISLDVQGHVSDEQPLLLIGNHISYLDIPLLMSVVEDVSFVAKKELKAWPIIGRAAQAMQVIFVERSSASSRLAAREAIREGLKNHRRIVIFPSGTTCLTESKAWRTGAFEIARDLSVKVQPFRLNYTPLRQVAFIDQDIFPVHMFRLARLPQISASLEFHEPVMITDPLADSQLWQTWAQGLQTNTEPAASGPYLERPA